jgi:hypothetical protein
MSHNNSVYSFAAIECLRNSIRRPTQEHVSSCGGNVPLGDCVRPSEATVRCPGDSPQVSKGQRDRSEIQIEAWLGQFISYTENDDVTVMVLLNIYSRNKDVPDGVTQIGMNIIHDDMLLVQTNLVANQPLTDIRSVALVYHFQQFNHCHHGN